MPAGAAPASRATGFRPFAASWVVLLSSLFFVALASFALGRFVEVQDRLRFQNIVDRSVATIASRTDAYLGLLRAGTGLFAGSERISAAEFGRFVDELDLPARYPGMQGIGYSRRLAPPELAGFVAAMRGEFPRFRVWPAYAREEYHAIVYLEPLDRRNRAALGFDMFTDARRREAMARARDRGLAAVTRRVTLVQEIDRDRQAGFLIYVPVYETGAEVTSIEERRTALRGFVYAPFRARDLFRQVLPELEPEVAFRVYAAARPDERELLYESPAPEGPPPRFRSVVPLRVADTRWSLAVMSLPGFESGSSRRLVGAVGFIGILLSLLLFALTRAQAGARLHAEQATQDLARTEEAVRLREAELRLVLERMPIGCVVTDREFRVAFINPAAERLFGFTAVELRGAALEDLVAPPQRRRELRADLERLAAGDPVPVGTFESQRRDGQPVLCEWHQTGLRDEEGHFDGVLAMVRDITEQRSLEEQLRQSQKLEAVGRLAGGVAHDFNNILTATMGYSDLLLDEFEGDDARRQLVEEIRRSAERASGLVRQLLAFGRRQVLDPRVLDLNHVVGEIDRMLRRLIGEDVDMRVLPGLGLGRIRADQGQLEQIVVNLAVNGRDAMPDGGTLTIETGNVELGEEYARAHPDVTPGPYVLLAVTDTGTGMDAETMSHIFEPFFTTKGVGKGTGLGLSMVYGIVKQSGGHIMVYSEPGHGTTFKIYFPRVDAPAERRVVARDREIPPGHETILVVEDDQAVRSYIREVLERSGYTVVEAANAAEALAAAGERPRIDALITDVVMPGMGGRELAEALVARVPDLKILFVSGYTEDAVLSQGKIARGMSFLPKPFTPRALASRLREVLDRYRVRG